MVAHAKLKSKLQCKDRNGPLPGEVIKPSSVPERSGCPKNTEKKGL